MANNYARYFTLASRGEHYSIHVCFNSPGERRLNRNASISNLLYRKNTTAIVCIHHISYLALYVHTYNEPERPIQMAGTHEENTAAAEVIIRLSS